MVIVGIDPGQQRLGISSLKEEGDQLTLGLGGVIFHPRNPAITFNEYMNEGIYNLLDKLPGYLTIISPDFIVAEIIPVGRLGSNSELNVAAATTCKIVAKQMDIPWYEVGASTIKKRFTGDGQATKAKVRNEAIRRFPLLGEQHKNLKKEFKDGTSDMNGYPQDLFDAVAIACAGFEIYARQTEAS